MAESASRGDLAFSLFKALGLKEPTSSGKYGDSGPYLDGITSTLGDLGITNGVGNGQFGTAAATTRGQAFTMLARALGLADANTSIEEASAALVAAGIVKGKGNNPNELGLDEPLQKDHLQLLIDRIAPVLKAKGDDGTSILERTASKADVLREEGRAKTDPAYAAFLAKNGVRISGVDREITLRQDLFNEDAKRRSETYQRATDQSIQGVQTDFLNRGMFRSGTRVGKEAETRANIGFQQEAESYAAQRAHEDQKRALDKQRSDYVAEGTDARIASDAKKAAKTIEDKY